MNHIIVLSGERKINIPTGIVERPFIQQLVRCAKRIQDDDLRASDIDIDDVRI